MKIPDLRQNTHALPDQITRWAGKLIRKIFPLSLIRTEQGRSLPAALIALAVGSLLLSPFLSFVSSRSLGTTAAAETFQEQYAADAGVEYAIWKLLNDAAFRNQVDNNDPEDPPIRTFPKTINGFNPEVEVTALPFGSWYLRQPHPASINDGADLIYTGGDCVYALQGKTTKGFYCFQLSTQSWTSLPDTPIDIKSPGNLAYPGGGYIYGIFDKGQGNKGELYRFNLTNGQWDNNWIKDTPGKLGNNVDMAGINGKIYILGGQGNNVDFWAYDANNSNWDTLSRIPSKVGEGVALTAYDNDTLFAFQGNDNGFWEYDISSDSWNALANAPGTVKGGGSLAYHSGIYVYALQGGGNTGFWRYDVTINSWVVLTPTPAGVNDGGSLVFTNHEGGFALRGGGSTDFWEFNVTPPQYDITSQAGNITISSRIELEGSTNAIIFWDIE